MSFSARVKAELCRVPMSRQCCIQAEAYGVLLFCNSFSPAEVRVVTESGPFVQRLKQLFQRAFGCSFDAERTGAGGKRTLTITTPDKLSTVALAYGYDPAGMLAHHINFAVLEEEHCRHAFLRGAFLAGGSVTDPAKGYHLELASSHYYVNRELAALLYETGFSPKETTRKSNYLTYFKQSECIEDFLTSIGAPVAAMEVMNAKVEKHLRGSVNRRVNCDAANLDKTVDAAQEQMEAIRVLEERGMLLSLPDKLKEVVDLRSAHPEYTLAQLAELCQPPITKSAMSHRLKKLVELAER